VGGTAPYTWALIAGTLPAGLSFNTSTGAITGTPTATANGTALTFQVTDSGGAVAQSASVTFFLNVNSGVVSVTLSPRRAAVTTGVGQSFVATVTGTSNTSVSWSVDGVAGGNSTLGTISPSGAYSPPSTAGTHTVKATSVANTSVSASSS